MADSSYLKSLLGGLSSEIRLAMGNVLDSMLRELRLGQPTTGVRAPGGNFQLYPVQTTTPAVANEVFSIEHGLGRTPYVAIPMLDLTAEGAKLVPLTVERAADSNRIYLSSTSTSAPITLYLEA
jgi:hypothetical protein